MKRKKMGLITISLSFALLILFATSVSAGPSSNTPAYNGSGSAKSGGAESSYKSGVLVFLGATIHFLLLLRSHQEQIRPLLNTKHETVQEILVQIVHQELVQEQHRLKVLPLMQNRALMQKQVLILILRLLQSKTSNDMQSLYSTR